VAQIDRTAERNCRRWTAICFRCWTTPDRRAPVEVLLAIAREAPVVDALPQHLAEMKLLRVSRAPKYRR